MKKVLLFVLTAITVVCMSFAVVSLIGKDKKMVDAATVSGTTPTFSETKRLVSTDKKYMLLATGINDFQDVYEVGYLLDGEMSAVFAPTDKFYRAITIGANAKTWRISDLFDGYEGMIVWEVEYDKFYDVSFTAYARVGDREDGVLVTSDTVVSGTKKTVAVERTSYTTATKASSVYPVLEDGQTVANWSASSQMIVFDYKWDADNGDGTDYVQIQLWGTANQLSSNLRLQYSNNQLQTSYLGRTVALLNGWRQFRARLCDLPVNGAYGSETLTRIKISSGHRYDILVDNIHVEDIKDSDREITLDGTWNIATGTNYDIELPDYDKSIIKTLEMDLDLTDSGTNKFYVGLYDETTHYYGAYRFEAGKVNTGYTMDGLYASVGKSGTANYKHYHIVFNLSELNGGSSTKPTKLFHIKSTQSTTAGTISNIKFSSELPSLEIDSNSLYLYIHPTAVESGKILSYDISAPTAAKLRYGLGESSSKYFGTYYFRGDRSGFDASGWNVAGTTCTVIGTNLYHVEHDLSSLSGGSDSAPASIYCIWNNGTKTDTDGYNKITNIKWLDATNYNVTVTDGKGTGKYNEGEKATVIAEETDNKRFKEWQIGGEKVSDRKVYTFTVTGDTSITAVYDTVYNVSVTEGHGSGVYVSGEEVTVTANKKSEKFFAWKDGSDNFVSADTSYSFTVSGDTSLTALFGEVELASGFSIPIPDYDEELKAITALSFDVYVADEGSMTKLRFKLCDGENHYFGTYYFRSDRPGFDAGGWNVAGTTSTSLGGKKYRLTFDLNNLSGGSGTPGKLVRIVDNSSSNLTNCTISNMTIEYMEVSENAAMALSVPDNTAQVLKTASAPLSRDTTLSFTGAKGERETAQLTMYAKSNISDKELEVTFTDLKKGESIIPASAIETDIVLYNNVTTQHKSGTISGNDMTFGYFPNGLLPLDLAIEANDNSITVESGNNQGLFFIMNIPSTAEKGTYTGNVIISVEDCLPLCLPVEVNVYGFALPEQSQARTGMRIKTEWLKNFYGEKVWDTDDIYLEGAELLAERGISAENVPGEPYDSNSITQYINYLKAAAADTRINTYALEFSVDTYTVSYRWSTGNGASASYETKDLELPRYYTIEAEGKTPRYGMIDTLTMIADNSTDELDLFKKAIILRPTPDEPSYPDAFATNVISLNAYYKARDYVLANYDWTGKTGVRDSLAHLTYYITGAPMDWAYYGFNSLRITSISAKATVNGVTPSCGLSTGTLTYQGANGFCVKVSRLDPGTANDTTWNNYDVVYKILNNQNDSSIHSYYRLMWYTCVGMDDAYASLATNAPMIQYRISYWQQFELGIRGNHFWVTNLTQSYVKQDGEWKYVPVGDGSEADLIANGVTFEGQAGDGQLMFPVRDTYGAYGVNWLSTLRLENTAEGIDDYNYLAYAQSLIDEVSDSADKASFRATLNGLYNGLFEEDEDGHNYGLNTTDSTLFKARRNSLASLIEDLIDYLA